jgi:DNA-binding transcriptional ArsR family regulator
VQKNASESLDASELSDLYSAPVSADIFAALANPTRRDLLDLLRDGPMPVKDLADRFHLGRPAISEHLKVLRDAGLVREEKRGREHHYHLVAAPLRAVSQWLGPYEKFWRQKIHKLRTLLDEEP